jgi:hypothetical protein
LIILIRRRIPIMQFFVMKFSPSSRHLIPLRSKSSPKHSAFKHRPSILLP